MFMILRIFFLGLFSSGTLFLASTVASGKLNAKVSVEFPVEESWGEISVRKDSESVYWEDYSEARGRIEFEAGMEYSLCINEMGFKHWTDICEIDWPVKVGIGIVGHHHDVPFKQLLSDIEGEEWINGLVLSNFSFKQPHSIESIPSSLAERILFGRSDDTFVVIHEEDLLTALHSIPNLEWLFLNPAPPYGHRLDASFFADHWSDRLRNLRVSRVNLGLDWFKSLKDLNHLLTLSLYECSTSSTGLSELGKLDRLANLEISSCELSGASPVNLSESRSLRRISLKDTQSPLILAENLPNSIREASLSGSDDNDKLLVDYLEHFAEQCELKRLFLFSVNMTPKTMDALAGLKCLEDLYIMNTDLTNLDLDSIMKMSSLRTAKFPDCPIRVKDVLEIASWQNVEHVGVSSRVWEQIHSSSEEIFPAKIKPFKHHSQ